MIDLHYKRQENLRAMRSPGSIGLAICSIAAVILASIFYDHPIMKQQPQICASAYQYAMNRFVFTCPETGVVVLTDKQAMPACVEQLKPYPLRVYCPACRTDHRTTFKECKSFPLRRRVPINVATS
jgi:hypothetical protein